jgi:hypothetical protein
MKTAQCREGTTLRLGDRVHCWGESLTPRLHEANKRVAAKLVACSEWTARSDPVVQVF